MSQHSDVLVYKRPCGDGRYAPAVSLSQRASTAKLGQNGQLADIDSDGRLELVTKRVGTGRVVLDNKGNPVRQYEPYFSSTEIRDLAQPVVFTSNAAVSANQRFTYDALYRLIEAEGREHGSQGQPISDDFTSRAAPDDPTGLWAYTESYVYDLVGNILELQHQATSGKLVRSGLVISVQGSNLFKLAASE